MRSLNPIFAILAVLLLPLSCNMSANEAESGNPVAIFAAAPETAACAQSIQFDAGGSYHEDSSRSIINYEWDFDYNGLVFDVQESGKITQKVYDSPGALGIHTVALRVTDNSSGPASAITTREIEVSFVNAVPVADPGGPYRATRYGDDSIDTVVLDGSGSLDPDDPCDQVSQYAWDTDGDGLFGEADTGGTPWSEGSDLTGALPLIADAPWSVGTVVPVSLRVADCYGLWSDPGNTNITVTAE
jgi:hypothetical protein